MEQGRIKEFNRDEFFGFIERDYDPDVFFHGSDIDLKWKNKINEGDLVQFKIITDIKGLKAVNITKVS